MTNNQLTYWANIERERANRAAEILDKERIAAQRYAARLNYAASIYGADKNYASQMANITSQEKRAADTLKYQYDNMWFDKYGWIGLAGQNLYNDFYNSVTDVQRRMGISSKDVFSGRSWQQQIDNMFANNYIPRSNLFSNRKLRESIEQRMAQEAAYLNGNRSW